MNITIILIILALLSMSSYYMGIRKSVSIRNVEKINSAPIYHGSLLAIYSTMLSVIFILFWFLFEKFFYNELASFRNILYFLSIIIFIITSVIFF